MITVNFIHDSLPVGGLKLRLEAVPRMGEGIYLNETSFAVNAVNHVVYSDPVESHNKGLDQHCAYVYLLSEQEYFSRGTWSYRMNQHYKES